jgi:hypothetical protein
MTIARYTRYLPILAVVAGAIGFSGSGNGAASRTPLPVLSEQDKADIQYVARLPHHSSAVELDFSDPIQYRYFLRQWALGGADAKLYPRLFRSFEALRQAHIKRRSAMGASKPLNLEQDMTPQSTDAQLIVPLNYLTGFGPGQTAGTYDVTAFTSVPGTMQVEGTMTATTIGLYDSNYNPLGPATTVQQYGNGALMRNDNEAPSPASGDVVSQGSYFYTTMEGGQLVSHGGGLSIRAAQGAQGQYTMQNFAPIDVNGNGTIKICIVRGDADCDYRYSSIGGQMIVQLPIQDTFTIPEPFQPLSVQQSSGYVSITVTQPDAGSGGGCTLPANFNFWGGVTIAGPQMSWNFNPGPFSNPNGASTPCFPSNSNVVYDLQVLALGSQGGTTTYRFGEVKTTTNPPPPPPPGSAYLLPMVIAYGCLAEGSLVAMADGTTKAIQDVRIGERVLSAPHGPVLTVHNRTDGVEPIAMVRVAVAGGRDVLLTETHPLMTDRGPRMARDLYKGMVVLTANGPAKIVRIARERFAGKVWNLDVGAPDGGALPAGTATTFVANGFVVGDGQMQGRIERAARARIALEAQQRIAPEWRIDARNYAAQQAAREANAAQ